jgi:hypothetical protein
MAWKARLFMGLMLTVMLLAIAGPAMAGDNNRQERREERREDRQEFREEFREDDVLVFGHDFDDCCDIEDDFELDEEVFFVSDFDHFVPWYFFIEEIDIDCDGVDDRWDGWIHDECEVEVEFFDFD